MAFLIAVVITLITLISSAIVWARVWWFPVDISTHGPAIDRQFTVTFIVCGIIFILAQLGLASPALRPKRSAFGLAGLRFRAGPER